MRLAETLFRANRVPPDFSDADGQLAVAIIERTPVTVRRW